MEIYFDLGVTSFQKVESRARAYKGCKVVFVVRISNRGTI